MSNSRAQHLFSHFVPYLFVLLVLGYPLTVAVTGFFLESTRIASITVRAFYFCFLVYFGFRLGMSRGQHSSFIYIIAGSIFWSSYGFRVVFDVIDPVLQLETEYILAMLFMGTLPSFFIFASARVVPTSYKTVNTLFDLLLFTTACLLIQILVLAYVYSLSIFSIGRLGLAAVNPITFGLLGSQLFILSLFCFFENTKRTRFRVPKYITGGILGIIVMIMTGSRGPILAAIASCFIYFHMSISHTPKMSRIIAPFFIMVVALLIVEFLTRYFDLQFLSRIEAMFDFSSSTADTMSLRIRFEGYAGGITQFLSAPLFGSSIIVPNTNSYPHNLWIESLMAIGLVGTVFLATIVVIAFRCTFIILRARSPNAWIPLLFLQVFIIFQFSGNIWAGMLFFGLMSAVVATGKRIERRHLQTR